jgi:polyhydroxyalkanoate synthase
MRTLTDPRWFDAYIAEAGNVAAQQMQTAFLLLRPTQQASKWVTLADRASKLDLDYVQSFAAMETWTNDSVPFPAQAYIRYIEELYQQNCLIRGSHQINGQTIDLKAIVCPVLTVVAERDQICPPDAAIALVKAVGSTQTRVLSIPGGHVGAVVGSKAKQRLYPELVTWLKEKTCNSKT